MILDVGSGQGRIARPLVDFLCPDEGEYHGIEIIEEGVEFCRRAYSDYENFLFHHIPVYNQFYNPSGTVEASKYGFPFPDSHFTFVFLTSVFTHMLEEDIRQYVSEIQRVLKPGGRALMTFFLLEPESLDATHRGTANPHFKHESSEVCRVAYASDPEKAVA